MLSSIFCEQEAADIASSCVSSDPSSADAVYMLGLCFYYKDELDEGIALFTGVLALDSDYSKAINLRLKAEILRDRKQRGNYRITFSIWFSTACRFLIHVSLTDFHFSSR